MEAACAGAIRFCIGLAPSYNVTAAIEIRPVTNSMATLALGQYPIAQEIARLTQTPFKQGVTVNKRHVDTNCRAQCRHHLGDTQAESGSDCR